MNLLLNSDSPLMGLQWKGGSEIQVVLIDSGTQKTAPIFFASLIICTMWYVVPGKNSHFLSARFYPYPYYRTRSIMKRGGEEEKLFSCDIFSGKLLYLYAQNNVGFRWCLRKPFGCEKEPRSTSDILPSLIIVSFQAFSSLSFQNCIRVSVFWQQHPKMGSKETLQRGWEGGAYMG